MAVEAPGVRRRRRPAAGRLSPYSVPPAEPAAIGSLYRPWWWMGRVVWCHARGTTSSTHLEGKKKLQLQLEIKFQVEVDVNYDDHVMTKSSWIELMD